MSLAVSWASISHTWRNRSSSFICAIVSSWYRPVVARSRTGAGSGVNGAIPGVLLCSAGLAGATWPERTMKERSFWTAGMLILCAVPGNRASGQVTPARADSVARFPDTPVGKLGQELIEVINRGDSADRTAFVAGHVS